MRGIGREIGDARIDYPACAFHQSGQARRPTGLARSFEYHPEALLDQFPELAAAQRRLCLGAR